jgi:hypothetical protein
VSLVRRRTGDLGGSELRAEVAARLRAKAAEWAARLGPEGEDPRFGLDRAAQLEAGEPVRVYGWELPREHPAYNGWSVYVIEPDGSLTSRSHPAAEHP